MDSHTRAKLNKSWGFWTSALIMKQVSKVFVGLPSLYLGSTWEGLGHFDKQKV